MRKLTPTERQARALAVVAETERTGCATTEAIRRVNRRMFGAAARRASVAETARPAAIRGGVTGTRPAQQPSKSRVRKTAKEAARKVAKEAAGKAAKEAVRKASKRLRETLTAAAAPQPPPGAAAQAPASRPAARKAAVKQPHEMTSAELAAANIDGIGGASPFWGPTVETVRGGAVTETTAANPPKPLHTMTADELTDYAKGAYTGLGQAAGFASPTWAG
jgi:hypothetical protein